MAKYLDREDTMIARNDAKKFQAYQEEDNYDVQFAFKNGIVKRINELGYQGDEDDWSKIADFVLAKFKEHNIPILDLDINNWLNGKAPNDSEQSRPNVYKLCFALEMNANQTEEFFLKNYLCRPFKYKKAEEAVYYFCLNSGRTYEEAKELLIKIENIPKLKSGEDIETRLMEIPLSNIKTEEDFLIFMENHRYDELEYESTVIKYINSLVEECQKLAKVNSKRSLLIEIFDYEEEKLTVFDAEKGRNRTFGISNSLLPAAVKRNFPRKQSFTQINANTASDDTCRKMLVMLFFYKYYTLAKQEREDDIKKGLVERTLDLSDYFDEFEIALDQLLEKCGYVQTYWKNPFDRFILLCAKQRNPLKELKALLELYYTSVIDEILDEDEE